MPKRDLLSLASLTAEEIAGLIKKAGALTKRPEPSDQRTPLRGRVLGLLFEKTSTRTRVSFEVAMHHLGGGCVFLLREDLQLDRGETIADTARVFSQYLDGLVIRTHGHDTLEEWARFSNIPVINGLSDLHHPCQALGDLLTLRERFGALKGLVLAYLGDGNNNVAHSLIEGAVKVGMHIRLSCPERFKPDPAVLQAAQEAAGQTGSRVEVVEVPIEAASGADVLYTDVWVSMGREREAGERLKKLEPYQLNAGLLKAAEPHAVVMHCLPAHRGQEITAEVLDGPQSLVWQQAANRLPAQKAVLQWLLGAGD